MGMDKAGQGRAITIDGCALDIIGRQRLAIKSGQLGRSDELHGAIPLEQRQGACNVLTQYQAG